MMRRFLSVMIVLAAFVPGMLPAQDQAANPKVLFKTTMGDIVIELYPDKAPVTVKNFLGYVEEKFYDGLIFHRVVKGKIIQTGGVTAEMHTRSGKDPIKNESGNGLKNAKGFVAMARFDALDSATSQFFINVGNNGSFDKLSYCVFGKVITGMDVVGRIANVETGERRNFIDVPLKPVTIISATLVK